MTDNLHLDSEQVFPDDWVKVPYQEFESEFDMNAKWSGERLSFNGFSAGC